MSKTIDYIESKGFRIIGRYIYKRSETTRHQKVVGQLNDNNFFFFSDNVHPFKAGINFFNDTSIIDNSHKEYIAKVKENERSDFNVSYKEYYNSTSENSIFNTFLNDTTKTFLGNNANNYFDLRGVRSGYMEASVCFPFFDIDNNFKTAQIIKYGSNGKRIKSAFSTNWFHSYKPLKKALGLKENDKYSVQIDCFFGENYLKGSDQIIGIVEAPKTAVILKELYPNIDWIATAGEQALFNKDLTVLKDRKVVLFADAHTTKWKEFAGKKGFNYCNVLDIEEIEKGSDVADFILDENSIVFSELHEYLFSLNAGFFNFELNKDLLELDFQIVGKEKGYFTAVPYRHDSKDVLHQQDNSKDFKMNFDGKYFNIFSSKYSILNANIDWHKQDRKEDEKLAGMDKDSFVWHLQKCFRTLKHLNNEDIYLDVFETTLNNLLSNSNFRFNKTYVLSRLVPIWKGYNANLDRFKKHRDWKYKGGNQLSRKEFERELNNDKFKSKLNMHLLGFSDVLKENRFIDIETDLGLKPNAKGRGFVKIFNLVKEWNNDVIGARTLKTYYNKLSFFDKLEHGTKNYHPHISKPYRGGKKVYQDLNYKEITEITSVSNKKTIKNFLTFKSNKDTENVIKSEVQNLLNIIKDIEPMRNEINGKTKIYTFEYIAPINDWELLQKSQLNWKEAFPSSVMLTTEMINTECEVYWGVLKDGIKYLSYLKTLEIKRDTEKVFRLKDTYLEKEFKDYYHKEKLIKKVVNF
jgi:hypothetical protein